LFVNNETILYNGDNLTLLVEVIMPSGFFDRLYARIDKLDPESLQAQMLRLSQERIFLEAISQTIQEGVLVIDNEGRLLYANHAAEKMTGIEYARTKGRSVLRLLRDWDWEHLLEVHAEGGEAQSEWMRMVTREIEINYPTHRFIHFYAMPFNGPDANVKSVLIILRDVSNERKQEASVIESERINAIKNLAAGLAHEIGNPLNALNIHLQLLSRELKDVKDEAVRKSLQEITDVARSEIARLDAINTQFLGAIRPSKPMLAPEQPTEVLEETLKILKTEFKNRAIQVSVDIPESVPAVRLDRQQIKQVFFNLIKNALEAMPDGGSLKIVFGVGDAFVEIAFMDSGVGIPQEELSSIFEPYHTTKKKGSGLGLMIVQRIVEDHGGEIEVASKLGQGACFKIRLPRNERRVRMLKESKE
jgi:PAS domain S-box-containing protein